jgi:hypothetical protein
LTSQKNKILLNTFSNACCKWYKTGLQGPLSVRAFDADKSSFAASKNLYNLTLIE